MAKSERPWNVPVAIDDIPDEGRNFDLSAGEEVRAALAKLAGVRSIDRLSSALVVSRYRGGLHVVGQVSALVGQTCVVTLEPISNAIEEAIDLVFIPAASTDGDESVFTKPGRGRQEPPEPLVGGAVDLGAVASEFLMVSIDPYPRKANVEFAPAQLGTAEQDVASNPFAALEALKKSQKADKS